MQLGPLTSLNMDQISFTIQPVIVLGELVEYAAYNLPHQPEYSIFHSIPFSLIFQISLGFFYIECTV